jgi:hypothetical protein
LVRWGIILKCVPKKWDGGMKWIDLALDRERGRDIVNGIMNPNACKKKERNFEFCGLYI